MLQKLQQYSHIKKLINVYGPTEASVYSTATNLFNFTIKHNSEDIVSKYSLKQPAIIGRPIWNTQIYILDQYLQLVPIGAPGELYIGGVGLARCYLNCPELTAEKFIPNPFSDEPKARLYKTGDLARYLSDSNIEYLGRLDNQVKIRGFRIELGEVEASLLRYPGIKQTVAIVREDTISDKRLVVYVVCNQEPKPTIDELRRFLKQKLPDYMVPSAFVLLDALPLTFNGKVDRRALPKPDQVRPNLEKAFVAPRNALETQLAKIWEEVLGIQPIGVRDNFFELGGHSLLAVRLFALIDKQCGKSLPLATLFQQGTVEQLASILRQKGWSLPWSSLVPIQPQGSRQPFFCIHPGGGNVLCYADLARHLGPNQPFFGFQARGLDGKQAPHTKILDMATHYIQDLRVLQPQGPYLLGGFCTGGIVAFEMAQQLHAQNQKVALLVMVDCGYPLWEGPVPPHTGKNLIYYLRRLVFHWQRQSIKVLAAQLYFYFMSRVKDVSKKLSYLSNQQARVLETISLANAKARMSYEPQLYFGKIVIIQSSAYENRIPDCPAKWSELTSEGLD